MELNKLKKENRQLHDFETHLDHIAYIEQSLFFFFQNILLTNKVKLSHNWSFDQDLIGKVVISKVIFKVYYVLHTTQKVKLVKFFYSS